MDDIIERAARALREFVRMQRFRLGRFLVHAGLAAFPDGKVKEELTDLLWKWGRKVRAVNALNERLEP